MGQKNRHLITIEDLTNDEIENVLSLADTMATEISSGSSTTDLDGKILATLFYEPSTRTRLSFEAAMQRLGGSVISCPDMRSSSAAKGESLADTARVVSSYADVLVVRHYWDGAVQAMAEYASVPIINAGDGSHEHPTQTLCDLYTLKKTRGGLKGLKVVICGDLKHGRTIHSLIYALARFQVHLFTLPASGLDLPPYVRDKLEREYNYVLTPMPTNDLRAIVSKTDAIYLTPSKPGKPHQPMLFPDLTINIEIQLKDVMQKVDAFYVTRKQVERKAENSTSPEAEYPRIDTRFLADKRFKDTIVMHPLPRVDELSYDVDQDERALYFKQAAYGVPVRMALLKFILDRATARSTLTNRPVLPVYKTSDAIRPHCSNANCVTVNESISADPRFEVFFSMSNKSLLLKCPYCEHQVTILYVGHRTSKKYCQYDAALYEAVSLWLTREELALFESIKQAEDLGYHPYKKGTQRKIMDDREIERAIEELSRTIAEQTDVEDDLLILGIRTKGVILAKRIGEQLGSNFHRMVEVGEIDIHTVTGGVQSTGAEGKGVAAVTVQGRVVIVTDGVIYTGNTARTAMSKIFALGRPKAVRLAVLVDRGHREVPLKPDFLGKPIASAKGERVEVSLHDENQKKKDHVVVFAIINPTEAKEIGLES